MVNDINTGNVLMIRPSQHEMFLKVVADYNKHNGSKIRMRLVKKNEETGDMLFEASGISMLSDILEIGRRLGIEKMLRLANV